MEADWFLKLHKRPYKSLVHDDSILIAVKFLDGRYGFIFRREQNNLFCHSLEVIPGDPPVNECYLRGMTQLMLNTNTVITIREELVVHQVLVLHAECFLYRLVFYLNGADDIFYIKSIRRDNEVLQSIISIKVYV